MDYRYEHLLDGLVRAYIDSGEPISSGHLCRELNLPVSPATVRNMLRDLELEGYVQQPHTSSGRVPTDKGYRYYVDHLAFGRPSPAQVKKLEARLRKLEDAYGRPARATAKLIAHDGHAAGVSGWLASRDVQSAGISSLFEEDSDGLERREVAREVSLMVDNIDDRIEDFAGQAQGNVRVYIGSENPAFEADHASVLARTARRRDGEDVLLLLIGPKRMHYRRNVALLNNLATLVEDL